MKKLITILFIITAGINVFADTVDFKGAVFHPTGIIYNSLIKNAIIEVNPYIYVFDLSVTFENCKAEKFSTANFGANKFNPDNSLQLQKAINESISNRIDLYCSDSYTYSQSLLACNIYKGQYVGFGFNFYGNSDRWNNKTILTYTGNDFAYGVEMAKGGSIKGISFVGQDKGSGIKVDYLSNSGGSTGFFIEDCYVSNFYINYNISPTGRAVNGDIIHLKNIHSGKCTIGFLVNQPQSKGIVVDGFYSWDSCQIAMWIYQGNVDVSHVQIAGYCNQILKLELQGWNTFAMRGVYAESVYSLGTVSAANSIYNPPVNLQDMDIRLIPGSQIIFTSNSPKVRISNSALWFYNGVCCQPMNFSGAFIWDNNDCGKCIINNPQIQYIIPTSAIPVT